MENFNLENFFTAFRSMRAGKTQALTNNQKGQASFYQRQCFSYSQSFETPDQDVSFEGGFECAHTQKSVPQRNFGFRQFFNRFSRNTNIYDGPGNDAYSIGNRGIIDTSGNDVYARNISINTFNTVNNFYRQEVTPTVSPTVDPPSPTVAPTVNVNLTPLRNLLTGMEKLQPDGVLSDNELNKSMANPHYADLDGDASTISSEEMAIFNKIKSLNEDKDLLSNVMKGDYSSISDDQMAELGELSDAIKNLTQNR